MDPFMIPARWSARIYSHMSSKFGRMSFVAIYEVPSLNASATTSNHTLWASSSFASNSGAFFELSADIDSFTIRNQPQPYLSTSDVLSR